MARVSAMSAEVYPAEGSSPDDADEAGYSIYLPPPTEEELLSFYRTYREEGGEAFQPYETLLHQAAQADPHAAPGTESTALAAQQQPRHDV